MTNTKDPNTARINMITERLLVLAAQKLIITDDSHLHANHTEAKSSGGGHFTVQIISDKFQDKSAIERHKMVYLALGNAMGTAIHAISIKAQTPAEAATQQQLL